MRTLLPLLVLVASIFAPFAVVAYVIFGVGVLQVQTYGSQASAPTTLAFVFIGGLVLAFAAWSILLSFLLRIPRRPKKDVIIVEKVRRVSGTLIPNDSQSESVEAVATPH